MVKCWPSALQDIDRETVDVWVLDGAADVRHTISIGLVDATVNDLICIAHNRKIWIVSNDNYLPLFARFTQTWNKNVIDRLIVEILFGLVNNEGIIPFVDKKIEDQ